MLRHGQNSRARLWGYADYRLCPCLHDQKNDLVRQQELLEAFCQPKAGVYEIIADLGSGLNYKKTGLQRLLELILFKRIHRLVLTHKDRLLRFSSELIFALCEIQKQPQS
jgi:predicted site-specific integrase-resolvase